jgi:hypothetical protein
MRAWILAIGAIGAAVSAASSASAATIVIYTDPMTLERRAVVVRPDGPHRAYYCMLPPAASGCQEVPVRAARR